jgi:hypothetical protein
LSHRVTQYYRNLNLWRYHTLLGLNSYVSDVDKSFKSGLKFIKLSGVPLLPLFATFRATAERKIIEILIYDYRTLQGANSYVFDDNKSIKCGFKIFKLSGVSLFTISFHL